MWVAAIEVSIYSYIYACNVLIKIESPIDTLYIYIYMILYRVYSRCIYIYINIYIYIFFGGTPHGH